MKGIITTLLLGGLIAEVGLTGMDDTTYVTEAAVSQVSAQPVLQVAVGESYGPPVGYVVGSRADVQSDIAAGLRDLDQSARQLPDVALKVAEQVEQHGALALMYENPEVTRTGNELGVRIGNGIRHLAVALGKDLVASAQASLRSEPVQRTQLN